MSKTKGGIIVDNYDISILQLFLFWKLVEWMAATRVTSQLNIFENRDDCKCLFQRNTVPLETLIFLFHFNEMLLLRQILVKLFGCHKLAKYKNAC